LTDSSPRIRHFCQQGDRFDTRAESSKGASIQKNPIRVDQHTFVSLLDTNFSSFPNIFEQLPALVWL
jgi:hypothetical protein